MSSGLETDNAGIDKNLFDRFVKLECEVNNVADVAARFHTKFSKGMVLQSFECRRRRLHAPSALHFRRERAHFRFNCGRAEKPPRPSWQLSFRSLRPDISRTMYIQQKLGPVHVNAMSKLFL